MHPVACTRPTKFQKLHFRPLSRRLGVALQAEKLRQTKAAVRSLAVCTSVGMCAVRLQIRLLPWNCTTMPTSASGLGCAHTIRDCAPCHHHLRAPRVLHSSHISTRTAPHTSAPGRRPPRSYQCQKLSPNDTHLHWDVASCHLSSSPESHRVATFAPEQVYLHHTCSGVTRICHLGIRTGPPTSAPGL